MALTRLRASEIAEFLIIMQGTLAPAITNMCWVQADGGSKTAIETRAVGIFTLKFVLMAWTVIESVAAHIHWQAVAIT